uniref:DDE_3 domain-containing protein n=1 Tax=Steinernema glaseri TaxID=37863 RepID=A0A1I8AA15_9BILA
YLKNQDKYAAIVWYYDVVEDAEKTMTSLFEKVKVLTSLDNLSCAFSLTSHLNKAEMAGQSKRTRMRRRIAAISRQLLAKRLKGLVDSAFQTDGRQMTNSKTQTVIEMKNVGTYTEFVPVEEMEREIRELRTVIGFRDQQIEQYQTVINELMEKNRSLMEKTSTLQKKLLERNRLTVQKSALPITGKLCKKSQAVVSTVTEHVEKMVADNPQIYWTQPVNLIVKRLTGISEKTVKKCRLLDLQLKVDGAGRAWRRLPRCRQAAGPLSTRLSKRERNLRAMRTVKPCVLRRINTIVDGFHRSQKPATAKKISDVLKKERVFIRSRKMNSVLHGLGYRFRRVRGRTVNTEKPYIVARRKNFLKRVEQLRKNRHMLYYIDETWLWKGMSHTYDWELAIEPAEMAKQGLSLGPSAPPGRGQRAIVTHCLGPEGMLDGALDIFISNKSRSSDQDYHRDMNSAKFERWFEELCKNIENESVRRGRPATVVMDNASYHRRLTNRLPRQSDPKAQILDWSVQNNIHGVQTNMTKAQILHLISNAVNGRRHLFEKMRTTEIAENHGIGILFLPPFHCRLNPIEMVWGIMKEYVRKQANMSDNLETIKRYCEEFFAGIQPHVIIGCIAHVIEVEAEYQRLDQAIATRRRRRIQLAHQNEHDHVEVTDDIETEE